MWGNRTSATNRDIELRYIAQDGTLQTSIVVANSSLDESQPSVAYNPQTGKALVIYTVRESAAQYSVRGRLIDGR